MFVTMDGSPFVLSTAPQAAGSCFGSTCCCSEVGEDPPSRGVGSFLRGGFLEESMFVGTSATKIGGFLFHAESLTVACLELELESEEDDDTLMQEFDKGGK